HRVRRQYILRRLAFRGSFEKRVTRLSRRLFEIVVVGARDLRDFRTPDDAFVAELRRESRNPTRVLCAGLTQFVIEVRNADLYGEFACESEFVQSEQQRS